MPYNIRVPRNKKMYVVGVLLTTTPTSYVINAAASNQIYQIENVVCTNKTATQSEVTLRIKKQSTYYHLARTILVPANSTIILLQKATDLYLEEGDELDGSAAHNDRLELQISYRLYSD
jgi:hypothetical protein